MRIERARRSRNSRARRARCALACDLEHHPESLLPGNAGDTQPADASRSASEDR
ncbi:hypothetical protein [Burkholderia sp. BCC1988]|uniref:hypothetical protein n=1 Tax=Burkholderia sp. BCC1988 TaxID=2817443 RepID=UPI002AAF986C|nr:hypothetical protein [Burkholderia sp. BCC1988]